ncbi:hypothetical protein [Sulfuricurvum sp.]|uniref:hypothetical protein n=1 Tax=Sulfuricurvum sp. TaxID=2025608 RepID=UPI0035619262
MPKDVSTKETIINWMKRLKGIQLMDEFTIHNLDIDFQELDQETIDYLHECAINQRQRRPASCEDGQCPVSGKSDLCKFRSLYFGCNDCNIYKGKKHLLIDNVGDHQKKRRHKS